MSSSRFRGLDDDNVLLLFSHNPHDKVQGYGIGHGHRQTNCRNSWRPCFRGRLPARRCRVCNSIASLTPRLSGERVAPY